jgi:hypothetical protein
VVGADLEGGAHHGDFHFSALLGNDLICRGDLENVVDVLGIVNVPSDRRADARSDPGLVHLEGAHRNVGISMRLIGVPWKRAKGAEGDECGAGFHDGGDRVVRIYRLARTSKVIAILIKSHKWKSINAYYLS